MKTILGVILVALFSMSTIAADTVVDRDCGDSDTQRDAQRFFEANGPGDPHRLDGDDDGVACESLV